jgi:3-oxoacyl-[acyl-carrier protein] reductase
MLLSNKVAIITGGARGIGRGTALKFAGEGCNVVIADLLEDEGKKTAEDISKKGVTGLFIKTDVTNAAQVKAMVATAKEKFGKIDILVNDAGAMFGTFAAEEEPEDHWEKVMNLNLKSDYLTSKKLSP